MSNPCHDQTMIGPCYLPLSLKPDDSKAASRKCCFFFGVVAQDHAPVHLTCFTTLAAYPEDSRFSHFQSLKIRIPSARLSADAERLKILSEGLRIDSKRIRIDSKTLKIQSEGLRSQLERLRI